MPVAPLDHRTTGYRLETAYWLAKAAQAAYLEEDTARAALADWGFEEFRHVKTAHTAPFPLSDTQAYVAASDKMIIAAFRGTEPAQIRDWLTDVTTPPAPAPGGKGYVHFGFHQALADVFPEVRDAAQKFRTDGQSVWITGHSLGGALAMLAGSRLYFEEPRILADGVYTFGQPRTCDRTLAMAYNSALKNRTYRFVNNNDIVAQVPSEPVFTHVDTVKYFDAAGRLQDRPPLLDGLRDKAKGYTADMFAPASDGLRDHSMTAYLANLEKNLG
ncbi:lipase family protein [Streptomyces sp. NPDC051907]|uniref:lipase family protein n=1 Tax=Streptomyces sp. NPDC051907 TaxID=3155284 RepID=UPI0034348FC1